MIKNTNSQILKYRINSVLYGGLPGLLLFILIAFGSKLAFTLFSCFAVALAFILFTLVVQLLRNKKGFLVRQGIGYVDRPLPSIWDFLFAITRSTGSYLIMFLITTPIMLFLQNSGLMTPLHWYLGLASIFLWGFLYASYSMLTTEYTVVKGNILLSSGFDKISVSIQEIQAIKRVSNILHTMLYDTLVSKSPLIIGVRVHNLLLLERKKADGISSLYFSRIYITPSKPDDFLLAISRLVNTS